MSSTIHMHFQGQHQEDWLKEVIEHELKNWLLDYSYVICVLSKCTSKCYYIIVHLCNMCYKQISNCTKINRNKWNVLLSAQK